MKDFECGLMKYAVLMVFAASFLTGCLSDHSDSQRGLSSQPRIPSQSTGKAERNFTGSWAENGNETRAFSLDLKQNGNQITGYHSAVAQRGNRIDATLPSEESPSIAGFIENGVALVWFKSGYGSEGGGRATLSLDGNQISWRIVESYGVHYLPAASTLNFKNADPGW